MVVIEGLKDGPVKGEVCRLTLYGDGDVIEHFDDKSLPLLVGKWKTLEPHGRIVDLDKVLNWLINDKRAFSIAMSAKIVKAISDAPVILKASATTPSKNHYCPYYQGVCGLDEDILCYCSSSYETCDTYKESTE